jgi:hypothetical protein
MIKFIQALKYAVDYSGTNTVVFGCDEYFVKKFSDLEDYEDACEVHKVLDNYSIVPPMIDNFVYEGEGYIVVEKVRQLDEEYIEQFGVNSDATFAESMTDYEEELDTLIDEANGNGFNVDDIHFGNFGYDKHGNFVCLDEGCFYKIETNDYVKEFMKNG